MPNLFPENYQSQTITSEEVTAADETVGYKQSVYYDYKNGEIVRDGQNKVLTATGIQAWETWCYKCLNTERYTCAAYSSDFGIEAEKALAAESKEEAEAILTLQITEALMADPYKRTQYISDITFNWIAPDSVEVSVTAYGIYNASIDIITTLGKVA